MISWLENHMLPCAYKSLFGIDCPICGAQRSLVFLLKGNLKDSFLMYPPLIPVLLTGITWLIYLLRPSSGIKPIAKRFTWFTLAVIAVNYVVQFF